MPQATITIQAKQAPAIGKKQGKVQDMEGNLWNVWGDKLQNYREGVTYDIVYEQSEFNGHMFNVIKTANPAAAGQMAHAMAANPARGQTPPPQQATAKDEMIFVCGIMNNSLSNANINPFELTATELITMTNKARQVWRNTLGKSQSNNDDIDDSIPF